MSATTANSRTALTTGPFTVDDVMFLESASPKLLAAASRGDIDLNLLARQELARRGLSKDGLWVGHREADALYRAELLAEPEFSKD